jgi:phage shock protein A
MSMWRRMKRMVRSWFGWAAELGEDPELILKQNIRDLEAEVPKLNEQLAVIAGQKNVAERELTKMKDNESDLVAKAKASLKANRRDIAQQYVLELEKLKPQIQEKDRAVKAAREAYDKAQAAKKIFMSEKDKKIQEAQRALGAKRQADWNEKVANTLANFQFAGVDQTHDEMIRKIEEQTARSEAKLQMALDGKQASGSMVQIEEDAKKIQAEETLRQFELEMGMAAPVAMPSEAETNREKTMGPQEREKA